MMRPLFMDMYTVPIHPEPFHQELGRPEKIFQKS